MNHLVGSVLLFVVLCSVNFFSSEAGSSVGRAKRAVGSKPPDVTGNCGGRPSGQSGYIASPNFPKNRYPSLSVCNWTITVNTTDVVKITFIYMDLEDGPVQKGGDCSADYISIYDEVNPDKLLGNQRFCGFDTVFKPLVSDTNTVSIDFESDSSLQYNGFAIRWQAVKPPKVMVSCDFELSQGLCKGWTQRNDDDFDWTLRSGSTPSRGTGPRYDHTFGPHGLVRGTYAYIEASQRRPNDQASISSPLVDTASSSEYCLSFWYHMRGNGIGELRLYQLSKGQPLTSARLIFNRRGDEKDKWRKASISIAREGVPIQFIFSGIRGKNFRGDVAVDDITLLESRCI